MSYIQRQNINGRKNMKTITWLSISALIALIISSSSLGYGVDPFQYHTGSYGGSSFDSAAAGYQFLLGSSSGSPSWGYGYRNSFTDGGSISGNGFMISRSRQTFTDKGFDSSRTFGHATSVSNSNYNLPPSFCSTNGGFGCGNVQTADNFNRNYDVTTRNDYDRSQILQNDYIQLGSNLGYGNGYLGRRNFFF